jgi:hypothetical protein
MTRLGFSLASSAVGRRGKGGLAGTGNLAAGARGVAAYPVVLATGVFGADFGA